MCLCVSLAKSLPRESFFVPGTLVGDQLLLGHGFMSEWAALATERRPAWSGELPTNWRKYAGITGGTYISMIKL